MDLTSFSVLNDHRQREVHASTLLLYKDRLLSAWFGGSKEGNPDTKIWLSSRSLTDTTGGSEDGPWTDPRIVAGEDANAAHWNPVLFRLPGSETILLFYKVGSPISSWETFVQSSADGGLTWSTSKELVPGDKGTSLWHFQMRRKAIAHSIKYRWSGTSEKQTNRSREWHNHRTRIARNCLRSMALFC